MSNYNFINAAAVRKFALAYANETRAKKFERVSKEFLSDVNAAARLAIESKVRRMPSIGKTLK